MVRDHRWWFEISYSFVMCHLFTLQTKDSWLVIGAGDYVCILTNSLSVFLSLSLQASSMVAVGLALAAAGFAGE